MSAIKDDMLSDAERRVIARLRADTADRTVVEVSGDDLDEMSAIFKRL